MLLNCGLARPFEASHFLWVIVVVCERSVHVSHIEIMTISDRSGIELAILDLLFDESDRDSPPFEVRLVVYLADDPSRHLAHAVFLDAITLEHQGDAERARNSHDRANPPEVPFRFTTAIYVRETDIEAWLDLWNQKNKTDTSVTSDTLYRRDK